MAALPHTQTSGWAAGALHPATSAAKEEQAGARAQFETLEDGPARFAVADAVASKRALEPGDPMGDAAVWLAAEYPRAISHIRLARRASVVLGFVLLFVIVSWRFTGGEA